MLYTEFTNCDYQTWHLGEVYYVDVHDVFEIQADGDELEAIRDRIQGIPDVRDARVVAWYGDIAKFIAGALMKLCDKLQKGGG